MTKTLTEQWRNEELPIDLYYVIDKLGRETIGNDCGIRDMMVDAFNGGNIFIKEVLAPVPSYDEWKKLDDELKELATMNDTFAIENGRLRERLVIAKKALVDILNDGDDYWDKDKAQEALVKMEGVK